MRISRWYLKLQTHTYGMCNAYFLSTAAVVARTPLSVTCICPLPVLFSLSGIGHRLKHNRRREWFLFCSPAQNNRCVYLTLYAPCIILQYVYEPTRCTEFVLLDFIFPLDALHVSDYISPSSGSTFISCTSHLVYADTIRLSVVCL